MSPECIWTATPLKAAVNPAGTAVWIRRKKEESQAAFTEPSTPSFYNWIAAICNGGGRITE